MIGDEKELVTTPGHEFLTAYGGFRQVEQLMAGGAGTLVLADGTDAAVSAERIVYSAETAEMFEQADGYFLPQNGNLALNPEFKTYKFEVEDFPSVSQPSRRANAKWPRGACANWSEGFPDAHPSRRASPSSG
ncbi:hypothetical protein [Roseibium sp.]|uniref:hypothetical protein n=1 Tax=Roseibium sp. TaxID=1936156 RepID=UPI003A97AF2A